MKQVTRSLLYSHIIYSSSVSSLFPDCRIQNVHITINQYPRDDEEKKVKTIKLKNEYENSDKDVFEEEPPFQSNRRKILLTT